MLSTLIALSAFAPTQNVNLTRKPTVGEVSIYAIDMSFTSRDTNLTIKGKAKDEVIRVESGTYVTNRTVSDLVVNLNGTEQQISDASSAKTVYMLSGQIVDMIKEKKRSEDFRMANLTQVVVPSVGIAAGTKWKVDLQSSAQTGLRTSVVNLHYVSDEKVGRENAARISLDSLELEGKSPMSAKGDVWLSLRDGRLLQSNITVSNASLGDGKSDLTLVTKQTIQSK